MRKLTSSFSFTRQLIRAWFIRPTLLSAPAVDVSDPGSFRKRFHLRSRCFLLILVMILILNVPLSAWAVKPPEIELNPEEHAWLKGYPEKAPSIHLTTEEMVAREEADYLFENLNDRLNFIVTDLLNTYHDEIPRKQDEHETKTAHLINANPFLKTINYIDVNRRILFVSPFEPNRKVIGLKIGLSAPNVALEGTLVSGKPVLSRPFVIIQGQMGYSLMIAHPQQGAFELVFKAEAVFGPDSPFRRQK